MPNDVDNDLLTKIICTEYASDLFAMKNCINLLKLYCDKIMVLFDSRICTLSASEGAYETIVLLSHKIF